MKTFLLSLATKAVFLTLFVVVGLVFLKQSYAATPTGIQASNGSVTLHPSATSFAAGGHDYYQDFSTNVPAWPAEGLPPKGYEGWCAYPDGTDDQYYPSQVVSVHDGVLDIYDHASKAAALLPFCYDGFTYGTYTVRMRQDSVYGGYRNSFMLWPNSGNWPEDGEFDFPENETGATNPYARAVQANATFLPMQSILTPHSWTDGQYHAYTQQWGPGFVRFYQDGVLLTSITSGIPKTAMHPILKNQYSKLLPEGVRPNVSLSGHVYIDSIIYDKSYTVDPSKF